jgi:predicted nucleic acid-binding protein
MEKHPRYLLLARELFRQIELGRISALTSMLVITELLTKPLRDRNKPLANMYLAFLSTFPNLQLKSISYSISLRAAKIRAKHGLKTPDAIFLATAIEEGAEVFVTNDLRMKKVRGIEIILLDEFVDQV